MHPCFHSLRREALHRLGPHLMHAMGRHRGSQDAPSFGAPDGLGGDSGSFTRGRKFSADDLHLMLLALIEEQPSHGYELIKELEARSNGFYSPSPGMVYPALTYLEELGRVTVEVQSNKKCYELADAGREYLAANRERAVLLFDKLKHVARKMEWLRRALAGEAEADEAGRSWLPEFVEARRALKLALLKRTDAPAGEQRRIAAILARATADITGESPPAPPAAQR